MDYITREEYKMEFFRGRLVGYEEGLQMALSIAVDLGKKLTVDTLAAALEDEIGMDDDFTS